MAAASQPGTQILFAFPMRGGDAHVCDLGFIVPVFRIYNFAFDIH